MKITIETLVRASPQCPRRSVPSLARVYMEK